MFETRKQTLVSCKWLYMAKNMGKKACSQHKCLFSTEKVANRFSGGKPPKMHKIQFFLRILFIHIIILGKKDFNAYSGDRP